MNSIYIVIKNMQIINANLSSSYFTTDLSQNAYLGFAHNLARYLDSKIPQEDDLFGESEVASLGNEKAFSILKQFEFNQGHASFAGHLNDNNHQALNIPMNPPEIKGTIKQTLVMQLFVRNNHHQLKEWITQFLFFNRFSGGDIQQPNYLEIDILTNDDALEEKLQREKGWVVIDATDQLIEVAQKNDYSHAFCDFLSTFKSIEKGNSKKENKTRYKRHHNGWFYASLAGYQLLEAPKTRSGARYNHPHAFAEPIIGLHQLEYFRQQSPQTLFWSGELNNTIYHLKQGI
jgi:CRISPR type I-F-associated protein Csy2